jgi:carbon monoxide dehydrogenase subunit G
MELTNTRIVPAPPSAVWAALNDPAILKECLPGCESLERAGENAFQAVMATRVGPVSARFTGRVTMSDIEPPNAYTLHFEGQGGAAGFARGEARITLAPDGDRQTSLHYAAKAQVGGKLAQIGSRLVDGAAAKMTDDFFTRFVERVGAPAAEAPVAAAASVPATALAPPGGSTWIRYAAIIAIVIVLIALYWKGYR